MIRVFIGYDPREAVAFNVLSFSILRHATQPTAVTPLALSQLDGLYKRERHPLQSTDFSFTRFLTPHLSNFEGWSVFMDCDMLMKDDIANLWNLRDDRFAIQVVKHEHVPKEKTKFLNQPQSKYEKKNWSSVILFNNAKCRALNVDYVNTASGLELHQFKWLNDDRLIGEIPPRWNYLVGCNETPADVALAHFTLGGPYFEEYRNCEFSDEWRHERDLMLFAERRRLEPQQ